MTNDTDSNDNNREKLETVRTKMRIKRWKIKKDNWLFYNGGVGMKIKFYLLQANPLEFFVINPIIIYDDKWMIPLFFWIGA